MRTVFISFLALYTLALAGCSGFVVLIFLFPHIARESRGFEPHPVSSDPYTVAPGSMRQKRAPYAGERNHTGAAFQTGRISQAGATAIGWATSTDGGTTWSHGFLPGLTTGEGSGQYDPPAIPPWRMTRSMGFG